MKTTGHHTVSVWEDAGMPASSSLSKDEDCDVCVVGAGIAGMTTGYLLAKEGKRVIVVDDGKPGSGETGHTTAHLSCILGSRYHWLIGVHGKERAALIMQSHMAAIAEIERIVRDERIDCDFKRVDGYLFRHEDDAEDILQKELDALKDIGFEEVSLLPSIQFGNAEIGQTLKVPHQGQFHALQYLSGLVGAFARNGGRLFTETHVSDLAHEGRWLLKTDRGLAITADAVVLATNAPIKDNVQIYGKQAPYRTFALAGTVPQGTLRLGLYWDTQDPYHYVRVLAGEKEDTLIIGGEDHKTGQANDAGLRFQRLETWSHARFPDLAITHRWSGQVMESADGIAMIGTLPMHGDESLYLITGDSGNGLTHATIGGMLLRDLILGKNNPWQELYEPSRIRVKAGMDLLTENCNVATVMVKDKLSSPDARSMAPDTGMVIEHENKKIALYRDAKGGMQACSAVCPHKGCIVHWNSLEKSWDCPCHGSRFDPSGAVLNGPSSKPLEHAELPVDLPMKEHVT